MNNKNDLPNIEKKFDLLYETLEKYNQRYVTASLAIASVLMVIIGWLLTEPIAQQFFKDRQSATIFFVFIIVPFLIFSYIYSMLRVFNVNQDAFNKIEELDYIDKEYYECHKLSLSYKYIGIILNTSNYVILGVLVSDAHWSYLKYF